MPYPTEILTSYIDMYRGLLHKHFNNPYNKMDPPMDYGPMYKNANLVKRTPDGIDSDSELEKDMHTRMLNRKQFYEPRCESNIAESTSDLVISKYVKSRMDTPYRVNQVLDSYKSLMEEKDNYQPEEDEKKNKGKKDKIVVSPTIKNKELS